MQYETIIILVTSYFSVFSWNPKEMILFQDIFQDLRLGSDLVGEEVDLKRVIVFQKRLNDEYKTQVWDFCCSVAEICSYTWNTWKLKKLVCLLKPIKVIDNYKDTNLVHYGIYYFRKKFYDGGPRMLIRKNFLKYVITQLLKAIRYEFCKTQVWDFWCSFG